MTSPSPSTPGGDWPADVAARIESVVGTVRDNTTVPAMTVARTVVYGVVLGVLGATAVLLMVISMVRLLNVYLPFDPYSRRVWVVDLAASAIFLGTGAFAWRRRAPRGA
jgi:hypothetical protein